MSGTALRATLVITTIVLFLQGCSELPTLATVQQADSGAPLLPDSAADAKQASVADEAGSSPPPALPAPSLELSLQETLTRAVEGRDRPGAVAIFGVPFSAGELAPDEALTVVDGTGAPVTGATEPYALWPDGSVRWLRVVAQADVDAGRATTLALSRRPPPALPSLISSRTKTRAVVDTGAARFEVTGPSLEGPNASSTPYVVTAGGTRMEPGPDGEVVVTLDTPALTWVESRGTLRGPAGETHFDYRVRYAFRKHHTTVEVTAQFRHARYAQAVAPLAYTELGLRVTAAKPLTSYRCNLRQGKTPALLHQGFTASEKTARWHREWSFPCWVSGKPRTAGTCAEQSPWTFTPDPQALGVRIEELGKIVHQAGNDDVLTWLAAGDLRLAVDRMPMMSASGYRLGASGAIDVLFYTGAERSFNWGGSKTYRLGLDGHGRAIEDVHHDIQWPVAGRATFERYRDSGAFFYERRLPSQQDQRDFWLAFFADDKTAEELSARQPLRWREFIHWRRNYTEPYTLLLRWATAGNGSGLQFAREFVRYVGDESLVRSDGFDLSRKRPASGKLGNVVIDGEHQTTLGVYLLAWLSTDPWHAEIARDYAEYLLYRNGKVKGIGTPGQPSNGRNQRVMMRALRNIVWGRELCQSLGHADADRFQLGQYLRNIINTRVKDASSGLPAAAIKPDSEHWHNGWSPARGYLFLDANYKAKEQRMMLHFFSPQLSGDAFGAALPAYAGVLEPAELEDLRDILLGQAQFFIREARIQPWKGHTLLVKHHYYLDKATQDLAQEGADYHNHYQWLFYASELWHAFGAGDYWRDALFNLQQKASKGAHPWIAHKLQAQATIFELTAALLAGKSYEQLAVMRAAGPEASALERLPGSLTDDELRALAGRWQKRQPVAPRDRFVPLELGVEPLGGGRYRLSWAAPKGARQVRIKFADRPIVDWLGFDPKTRQYQHDPATHVAWFAAANVRDEPQPHVGEMIVDLGQSNAAHFAAKVTGAP